MIQGLAPVLWERDLLTGGRVMTLHLNCAGGGGGRRAVLGVRGRTAGPGDVLLELSGASPPDRNKPDLEDLTIFRSRSQDLAASGFWADARRQDTGSRLASCCVIVVANDYVRCLVPRSCPLVLHAPWFGSHPCLIADCSLVVSWPRAPPGLLVALAMSPGFSRPVDSLDRGFVGRGPRTASL
ncbi:hypothetical protein MRS44_010380 [Fusarium solani]|uniref:uncharacterized protein n=1 Tax=Fusarium solani TaxID=169388 RepID=UPI0032C405E3|nr:hypothetical protein MRS44_010380 [Fusarium solani]